MTHIPGSGDADKKFGSWHGEMWGIIMGIIKIGSIGMRQRDLGMVEIIGPAC